jgi:hypothetical protein
VVRPSEMFDGLCRVLRGIYSTAVSTFPNAKLTYRAIRQTAHQFDSSAIDLVKTSVLTNTMTDSDICVAAFPAHIHILPSMNLLLLCLAAEAADRNDHVAAILRNDVMASIKRAVTSDNDRASLQIDFFRLWLQVRLATAAAAADKEYCFNFFSVSNDLPTTGTAAMCDQTNQPGSSAPARA